MALLLALNNIFRPNLRRNGVFWDRPNTPERDDDINQKYQMDQEVTNLINNNTYTRHVAHVIPAVFQNWTK